jgi:hypothetical protein
MASTTVSRMLLCAAISLVAGGCAPSDPMPSFDVSDPGGEMVLTSSKSVVSVSAFRVGGDVCGPSASRSASQGDKLVELQFDGSTAANPPVKVSLANPTSDWRVTFRSGEPRPRSRYTYFVVKFGSGSEGRLCKPI